MTTEWAVVAAAEQISLDTRNSGEITFTVSNPGDVADTVVFDIVPGDGSQRAWFTVEEPQRPVPGQGSVSFLVKLTVPVGTAPRRYDMTGLAYSANTAPEESSRASGRVTYEVRATVKPSRPWPLIILAAVLVLVVVGVGTWLLTRPKTADPGPLAEVVIEAESLVPGAQVQSASKAADMAVAQPNCCDIAWSGGQQLFFRGLAVGDMVTITVTVPTEADYRFDTIRTTSFDYANTIFNIDGAQVGATFFGFTPKVAVTDWITVGQVHLSAGAHQLSLVVVGKTQGTTRYYAGVDVIRFREVRP